MTILSFILLLLLASMWLVIRARRDVSPLLALALLSYLILWNVYPILYGATLLDWKEGPASFPVYQRLVVLHLISLCLTLGLFAGLPSRVSRGVRDMLGTTSTTPALAIRSLIVGSLIYVVGLRQTLALRGSSYADATSFVMSAGSAAAGQVAILDTISYLILCLAMSCIVWSWRRHGKTISILGWAIVGIDVLSGVLQGVRAVILLPLTLLIAISLQRSREGRAGQWKMVLVVLSATLFAAPLLAAAMGVIRLRGNSALDVSAIQEGYDIAVANLTLEQRVRLAAQELNTKFDAFSYGANLLETDGIGTAGWKPYSSALLSPIPRVLLPEKPVPTSKNGDNSGTPYRVAGQSFGAIELGMVVPVSPAGVAIWELGYWGLVLLVPLNLIAWILANSLLASGSIFARALGVSMLSLPSTEFLFGAPSGLVRDLPRIFLYSVLLWVTMQAAKSVRQLGAGRTLTGDESVQ